MPARSLTNKNGLKHLLKRKALYRLLLFVSLLYILLSISIGFILPYLLKAYAPKHLEDRLKRPVEITHISINPLNLHTQIKGFAIQEKNGTDFIGFKRLDFTFQFWRSIFSQAMTVSDVSLTEPFIHVARLSNSPNITFNFSDILEHLALDNQTDETQSDFKQKKQASLLPLIANHIRINNAQADFVDTINHRRLQYHDINLSLNTLNSKIKIKDGNPEKYNTYQISLVGKNGGEITTNGRLQLFPFDLKGQMKINNLSLPVLWEVIADEFPAQLQQGQLDSLANYHLFISHSQKNDNPSPSLNIYLNNAEVSINNLILSHENTPFFSSPLIKVGGIDIDVRNKKINLKQFLAKSIDTHIRIDKQGIDIIDFITPHRRSLAQENKPELNTAAKWQINLDETRIEQAKLHITESILSSSQLWQFSSIDFNTGHIDSSFNYPIDYSAALSVNQQGDISAKGRFNLKDLSSISEINVSQLQLIQFKPYLDSYLQLNNIIGTINSQGKLTTNEEQQVTFNGGLAIQNFALNALENNPLLTWQSITIPNMAFNQQDNSLFIDIMNIQQAKMHLKLMNDGQLNVESLIKPLVITEQNMTVHSNEEQKDNQYTAQPISKHNTTHALNVDANNKTTTSSEKSSLTEENVQSMPVLSSKKIVPLNVKINQINIHDTSSHFEDDSLSPVFKSTITNLNGNIKKINSADNTMAPFDFTANINHHTAIKLKGKIAPFSTQPNTQFTLNIEQFSLPPMSPYSGDYIGYDIHQGLVSIEANYQIQDQKLTGDNHIVIEQIILNDSNNGNASLSLPLPFAIALLEDSQGMITLDLPVSGDLNSPQFNMTNLLNTTFIQLITKTISAPFTLLSSLLATDEALDMLYFDAASNQITSEQTQVLSQLASGLRQRPKLKVTIAHTDTQALDKAALSTKQLHKKITEMTNIDLQNTDLTAISTYINNPELSNVLIQLYEQASNKKAILLKPASNDENKTSQTTEQEQEQEQEWYQALYNQNLEMQAIAPKSLQTLTQSRLQTVKNYLVNQGQIASDRIQLSSDVTATSSTPLNVQLFVK